MPNHDGTGPKQRGGCQSNHSNGITAVRSEGCGGHHREQCCGGQGGGFGRRKNGQNNT